MVQRVRALVAPVFKITALELIVQGLGFAIMAIKFRFFGAAMMGLISYFGALGELPGAFYSNFNRGLQRFLPTAQPLRRVEIFLSTFLFEAALLSLLAIALALVAFGAPGLAFWKSAIDAATLHAGFDVGFVAVFTVAIIVFTLIQGLLGSLMTSMHRYLEVQIMKLVQGLMQLAVFAALFWFSIDKETGLWVYFWMTAGIILASVLFMAVRTLPWIPMKLYFAEMEPGQLKRAVGSVYREQFLPYTLPKQFTSVLAYVKENIAVLFLGHLGLMSEAGIFNLANKVFLLPRRFIPGIVNMMLPKMVALMESDRARFRSKYNDFSWIHFAIHAAGATALFAGVPVISRIFGVRDAPELTVVFYLFAANLVINAVGIVNFNIIELGKDMRWYMVTVMVRIAVLVAINLFLIPRMGSTGAVVALLASTMVVTALQAWDTRKTDLWDWNHNFWQWLIWIGLLGGWSLLFVLFPGAYPLHW